MLFQNKNDDGGERVNVYPVLPLRGVVVFPHSPMSLIVGRPRSIAAVQAANMANKEIFLVAQRSSDSEDPGTDDMHAFGTIAAVEQTLHLPDGNTKVLVSGQRRARIKRFVERDGYFAVELEEYAAVGAGSPETQALVRSVKTTFERYVKLNRAVPPEMLLTVNALEDPDRLADTLVAPLQLKLDERQELLEMVDVRERLERVYKALLTEIDFLQVEKKVKSRVKKERESNQREYWLNEQMKAIQKELGDKDGRGDVEDLARALAAKDLPDDVRTRAEKELRKLAQMNLMSAEATVVRNYLDWILQLPWMERSERGAVTLDHASEVLAADHFGLQVVKERILEYLAVLQLVDRMRGPILCLVGPPGVGKTSLARSIARSTGRPFARIALGGVRDEAEIRGHRRTYIGAMPGKLLHAMKRAETTDPVILLDEIDKMSSDMRGDPSSALLEVLDPEQNTAFNDHYMDLDYDLSDVMFVCTANSLQGIPAPLQDRLEIIELSGYTESEKLGIARRYLLPKQLNANGLTDANLTVSDKALVAVVQNYTKESGVRGLEREVARICRKVARRVVHFGAGTHVKVTSENLPKLLGIPKFDFGRRELSDEVGLVKGLAVSPWGGELLNIEVATIPGKGKLILTGRLGDWLKESATAGFTYLRSRAEALGLDTDFHEQIDVHVHYPGAVLKTDGPSAGIAMATAMVSAVTGMPVRSDTAMTGEISLRGRVLRIGGLKEKLLAAHRGGITRVLIPESNVKDLDEVPSRVLEAVEVIPVSHMDRVLKEALAGKRAEEIFGSYVTDVKIAVDSGRTEGPSRPHPHRD
jgi:ATP-dependent Lon protease